MKGYAAIPAALRAHDVSVVFAMLGGTNVAWIAEGVRTRAFRLFKTRHEETAVVAAASYAIASGDVGVCSVTRGPGFANAINALVSAVATHAPLVLVVGASPSREPDSALNLDQEAACRLIGVGFHHAACGADLPGAIFDAFERARWNGTPQVVSTADECIDGEVADDIQAHSAAAPRAGLPLSRDGVSTAVELLAGAEAPLIIAGRGAVLADCRSELVALADVLDARVATTLLANCFFAGHPRNLGLSGGWGAPLAYEFLKEADVVLAVGASMNEFTRGLGGLYGESEVIRCDIAEGDLVGDAKATARALIEELSARAAGTSGERRDCPSEERIRDSVRSVDLGHSPERGMDVRDVYTMFDEKLPSDRIVATDSGRSFATCPLLVGTRDANSWLVGRGYGTIGHGLGTAIGAAVACPERPVVLFTGDGGFMLASHDLDSVRSGGIHNLTIVVMNDEQYGSEMRHLNKHDLPMDVIAQPMPDVGMLARAYGGSGVTASTPDELDALELVDVGLRIIDARIDPLVDGREALAEYVHRARSEESV
jgi:acetolactate synthase I/II/III large subunit